MKRLTLVVIALTALMFTSEAQEVSQNAIGLRFGDNDGFGAEISYQRKLADHKRLQADLGFRDNKNYDAWKLTGVHQWVWPIDGGFNWFWGFGAGIGNVDINDNVLRNDDDDGFFLNANGNVGVEYNFNIPLLIAVDFRPEIGLINDFTDDDLDLDFALSVRYQF